MKDSRPSVTAQRGAVRRAAHQLLDEPKVFDDPVALTIVGRESAAAMQADPRQADSAPLAR